MSPTSTHSLCRPAAHPLRRVLKRLRAAMALAAVMVGLQGGVLIDVHPYYTG